MLEKNREKLDIGMSKDFLDRTPIAWEIILRVDQWNYRQLKDVCTAKEIITRMKTGYRSLPTTH